MINSMTPEEFKIKTGQAPIEDDLNRVNCKSAGAFGHRQCGWCNDHNKPRFQCGCLHQAPERSALSEMWRIFQ